MGAIKPLYKKWEIMDFLCSSQKLDIFWGETPFN
jgi:hypothetical protein